jgi:hypothetical protein
MLIHVTLFTLLRGATFAFLMRLEKN